MPWPIIPSRQDTNSLAPSYRTIGRNLQQRSLQVNPTALAGVTFAASAANAASALTSPLATWSVPGANLWSGSGSVFRGRGWDLSNLASTYLYVADSQVNSALDAIIAEVLTDAIDFEISVYLFGTTIDFRLWVDNEMVTVASATATGVRKLTGLTAGSTYRLRFTLPASTASGIRLLRFELGGAAELVGITVPNGYVVLKPPPPPLSEVRSGWIMDSYGALTPDASFTTIPYECCRMLEWPTPAVDPKSSTGFVAAPSAGFRNFKDRIDQFADRNLDVFFIGSGLNDFAVSDPGKLYNVARDTFNYAHRVAPRALVITTDPWAIGDANLAAHQPGQVYGAHVSAIRNAAADTGTQLISNWGWLSGSGNTTAVSTPLTPMSRFIGSDNTHPVQAGHTYLGMRFAHALASS